MKILVLGNGFDLAHGLPTQYKDFLDFCDKAKEIYTYDKRIDSNEYQRSCLDSWNVNKTLPEMLKQAYDGRSCKDIILEDHMRDVEVSTHNELLNELYTLIKSNMWVEYFLKRLKERFSIGENWIDFESEISRVIKAFDKTRKKLLSEEADEPINKQKDDIVWKILQAAKKESEKITRNIDRFDKFIPKMKKELSQLIRALEIYIVGFVENISVEEDKKIQKIKKLDVDHILSFNYTDTYKKLYEEEASTNIHTDNFAHKKVYMYDFIHGKANISHTIENCNMVLGIDEYLPEERRDKDIEFIAFKKYYQRIYKETGNKYLDWIDEIKKENEKYYEEIADLEVKKKNSCDVELYQKGGVLDMLMEKEKNRPRHDIYIFGHSLDITDKDILKTLICCDNVYTTIYYHSDEAHAQQIANLVKVIGQQELIYRTGGPSKTIEFKQIE